MKEKESITGGQWEPENRHPRIPPLGWETTHLGNQGLFPIETVDSRVEIFLFSLNNNDGFVWPHLPFKALSFCSSKVFNCAFSCCSLATVAACSLVCLDHGSSICITSLNISNR